jgi:hypothetical protein
VTKLQLALLQRIDQNLDIYCLEYCPALLLRQLMRAGHCPDRPAGGAAGGLGLGLLIALFLLLATCWCCLGLGCPARTCHIATCASHAVCSLKMVESVLIGTFVRVGEWLAVLSAHYLIPRIHERQLAQHVICQSPATWHCQGMLLSFKQTPFLPIQ